MKLFFFVSLFLSSLFCYPKPYADSDFYLVDSLELDLLNSDDRHLLDSCLNVYHSSARDSIKMQALEIIIENLMSDDWMKYQFYQLDELESGTLKDINLSNFLSLAYFNVGRYFQDIGNPIKAMKFFVKALKHQKVVKDYEGIASSFSAIGGIYENYGNIPKALDYQFKALNIQNKINDQHGVAYSLGNIALIYDDQGEFDLSLKYYRQALNIRIKIKDQMGSAYSYNDLAFMQRKLGNLDSALYFYQKSLEIKEKYGDEHGASVTYNNLGHLYRQFMDYEKSTYYYNKSKEIKEKLNDKGGLSLIYYNLGVSDYESEKYKNALANGKLAEEYAASVSDVQLQKGAFKLIYMSNNKLGNFQQAFTYYKRYIHYSDSLNNEHTQKSAAKQQALYEYEKQKSLDDAAHGKKLAIEQKAKEKQKVLTYATASGLGLVGIFLMFVFNRLKVTKKQKVIIEKAHLELEEKNKEITDSIIYAKRIQSAILPPQKIVKKYLDKSFILYKPKAIVAGDFYWMEPVGDQILFAAADCTGHGVPGAMVSVVCNNGLNRAVREHGLSNPGEILDKTREIVVQEFEKSEEEVKDGMDIAICSLKKNTLKYAGANNPLWVIRKDASEIEEIKATKQPIGKTDNPISYVTHTLQLQTGDTFYIFSDGFADQFGGEKGKKLKSTNFKKLLLSIVNEDMQTQFNLIGEAFENWKGDLEQLDDVCIIGVRI